MSRAVSPADRRRDRLALGLVVAGAALVAIASWKLGELAGGQGLSRGPSRDFANVKRADHLLLLSRSGVALILAGVATGLWSFARHAKRTDPPDHGQEHRS